MLHDLANDDGFVALKRAAEDRDGRRHRERMSKTCSVAEDYWWWSQDPQGIQRIILTGRMPNKQCQSTDLHVNEVLSTYKK